MKPLPVSKIPFGVADSRGRLGFVKGPQGLIYALDLQNGEEQARSIFPAIPLTIYDDSLIGWRPDLDVANAVGLFAAEILEETLRLSWEQNLDLPSWVRVSTTELDFFRLLANIKGKELIISWEAHSRYPGGAPPPLEVEAAEVRDARGVVYVDPASGNVLRVERHDQIPESEPALPALPANRYFVPYLQNEAWETQPWLIQEQDAYLTRTAGKPGFQLIRREIDRDENQIEIHLTNDPNAFAAVTPDGSFIFIHEPERGSSSWQVYLVKTGEIVAKLPYEPGTQSVSVLGEQVLYSVTQDLGTTQIRTLRCRNLHSGKLIWSFKIDEDFSKSPPPPPP